MLARQINWGTASLVCCSSSLPSTSRQTQLESEGGLHFSGSLPASGVHVLNNVFFSTEKVSTFPTRPDILIFNLFDREIYAQTETNTHIHLYIKNTPQNKGHFLLREKKGRCSSPHLMSMAASGNSGSWLAALWSKDFAGSVFARRHLKKLISDWLLRQCNILMIYNEIEWVLVITKIRFNYYNTNFSLEITSKVQKVNQKYIFKHN